MRTKRGWMLVGGLALVAAWLALFFDPTQRPDFSDFDVYWVAGAKAAKHLTVYDVVGHYQFKYSPFVAWLWAIPTHFRSSYLWSRLHYVATGVGWYVLLFALAKVVDARRRWALWLSSCVVFSLAIRDELKLGQVNLWPFLLVLPAWFYGRRAETRGWDRTGWLIGAGWGLAVQWKLYALVLGPVWLIRRRLAVFAGFIAITVVTLGAALAATHGTEFAIAENLRWVETLRASSSGLLVSQYNVSVLGVLGKWGASVGLPFGLWAYVVWLGLLFAGLATLVWAELELPRRDVRLPWFWQASFAWALVAVVNPLVWPYWQLLVAPLFLTYLARGTAASWRGDGPLFWGVIAQFTAMNWAQNTTLVHNGGGLVAIVVLMVAAYRQVRGSSALGYAADPTVTTSA